MKSLYRFMLFFLGTTLALGCQGQHNTHVNEPVLSQDFDRQPPFSYGMPDQVTPVDTSPGWHLEGQKLLLTGTVFRRDGETPAPNVLLYYYQTNTEGVYAMRANAERNMPKNARGQTHGHIRGWVQTSSDGRYAIYTVRPGSYPGRDEPAHVHVYVRESDSEEPYYIEDIVFDDDPLLTEERRGRMRQRGGSGIVFLEPEGDVWVGQRDIVLGLNIP